MTTSFSSVIIARISFIALIVLFLGGFLGCKKASNDTIPPAPVDTTNYTLTYADGGVPIVLDTIYKKHGDTFSFSWKFQGNKTFEILLNGQYFSNQKIGQQSIKVEQKLLITFVVGGKIEKSKVVVMVLEMPFPVIKLTYDSIVPYNGNADFSWVIQYSTAQSINGVPIDSIGSLKLTVLKRDTILHVDASNSNGALSSTKEAHIYVGSPPPITLDARLKGDWLKTDVLYKPIDSTQYASRFKPCEVDDHWKFDYQSDTTVGTFEMHQGVLRCLAGDELWASGGYFLISNNTQIVIGGLVYDIVLITDSQLILRFDDIGMVGAKYELVFQKIQKK